MPSPSTTNFPRPKSWDEFEDICTDVLKKVWGVPYLSRHGRSGQRQDGVDIYGCPKHLGGYDYAGAQCKETDSLCITTIEKEIIKAENFDPLLKEYLIMTTALRDAKLQAEIRKLNRKFAVHILFWEDISQELSGHTDLLQKHFSGWVKLTTTKDQVLDQIMRSQPEDFDYNDETGEFFYSRDIKLKIVLDYDTDEIFIEPWMNCFAKEDGMRLPVYIYYEGTRVFDVLCIYVDNRHRIPIPKSINNLTISDFAYHLGLIINHPLKRTNPSWDTFDNALRRAGISIRDA